MWGWGPPGKNTFTDNYLKAILFVFQLHFCLYLITGNKHNKPLWSFPEELCPPSRPRGSQRSATRGRRALCQNYQAQSAWCPIHPIPLAGRGHPFPPGTPTYSYVCVSGSCHCQLLAIPPCGAGQKQGSETCHRCLGLTCGDREHSRSGRLAGRAGGLVVTVAQEVVAAAGTGVAGTCRAS